MRLPGDVMSQQVVIEKTPHLGLSSMKIQSVQRTLIGLLVK